jgi:hypothetical protein
MPTVPTNLMQSVVTFNKSELGALQNSYALLNLGNKKFDNFQSKIVSNLGTTVSMRLPYRFITTNGLAPNLQAIQQNLQNLTVDQAFSLDFAVDDQERLFNLKDESYMKEVGDGAVAELGARAERLLALNADSSVPVNGGTFANPVPTGALHTESGPFRFYGDGVTAINSFEQLAAMHAAFRNYGYVGGMKVILPDVQIPAIIGSGLSKFALDRGNRTANSWEVGTFDTPAVEYYRSNLLPIHYSGTIGNTATTGNEITITALITDSTGAITGLTCSTAVTTDSNAIASGDLMQFKDGVAGHANVRFLTFTGHTTSAQPVQVRATAKAASSGGSVTVSIYPALVTAAGANQNVNGPIEIGMKLVVAPSHQCGLVISGDAFFIAMPRLPATDPYVSSVETDPESGASMRMYRGYIIEQSTYGLFRNIILGSTLVPQYSMRMLFPIA